MNHVGRDRKLDELTADWYGYPPVHSRKDTVCRFDQPAIELCFCGHAIFFVRNRLPHAAGYCFAQSHRVWCG